MSFVLPTVVIVSCCDDSAIDLATAIQGSVDEISAAASSSSASGDAHGIKPLEKLLWSIDTKYYVATAELCALSEGAAITCTTADVDLKPVREALNAMEAIIIRFDSTNRSSFQRTQDLMKVLDDFDAEVRLLVCSSFQDDSAVKKSETQSWCIENGFELVELDPEQELVANDYEETELDISDNFADVTGVKRVVQALHSHTWSNLVLKVNSQLRHSVGLTTETQLGLRISDPVVELNHLAAKHVCTDISEGLPDDESLQDFDVEEKSFEALFHKFQTMKDGVKGLPDFERKEYAEQVAVAFWKAIGGDDEDIEGLDSLEDNETSRPKQ